MILGIYLIGAIFVFVFCMIKLSLMEEMDLAGFLVCFFWALIWPMYIIIYMLINLGRKY